MLTLLRKIRRTLIESGSTRKYLLYALGEISLVVIGILIALQINNWNEWRKERIMERQVLKEIAENIEFNIIEFERFSQGGKRFDAASDYVMAVLDGKITYSDSLDRVINRAIYRRNNIEYSTVSYEALKNGNLNLILNNRLKKEIIQLFEITYPKMINNFDWGGSESQPEYMDHHFFPISTENDMIWQPYDFSVQMKDNYFKSLIAKIKIQRKYYIEMVQKPLSKSKLVLQLIREELEKK